MNLQPAACRRSLAEYVAAAVPLAGRARLEVAAGVLEGDALPHGRVLGLEPARVQLLAALCRLSRRPLLRLQPQLLLVGLLTAKPRQHAVMPATEELARSETTTLRATL